MTKIQQNVSSDEECSECGGHGIVTKPWGNRSCSRGCKPLPHIGSKTQEQHETAIRQEEEDEESFNNGPFGVGA